MNKAKTRFNVMAVVLIIIFCIAITPKTLQNDTFYTIKIGENILKNGIGLRTDPFSWHGNLEYTFPHWAYDVMIFFIYNIGGMLGIYISTMVLASILGVLMYYTNVKLVKNRIFSLLITIGTMYIFRGYICARAQLVTFILFLLTVYFIERFLEKPKIGYAIGLVIIPILIANLHLATFFFYFILYLPYFGEYVLYVLAYCNVVISDAVVQATKRKIEKNGESKELTEKLKKAEEKYNRLKEKEDKKFENPYKIKVNYNPNIKWLAIIFLICIFTGFLTPLKTTPYTYLIKTMQGISTKNISEHLPTVLANSKELMIVFLIYIVLVGFTKIKIRLSDLFMVGGLTVLAIFSRRQASMLYLIGGIIINRNICQILELYKKDAVKTLDEVTAKWVGILILSEVIILISILQFTPKIKNKYINSGSYPVKAAEWIKENLDLSEIKLYNEYNYGSYLIYKDIPVFIDSRCDLYMTEFNKDANIFKDFLKLNNLNNSNVKSIEKIIDKYGFTHFILYKTTKLNIYMELNEEEYVKIYPTEDIDDKLFTIYERVVK